MMFDLQNLKLEPLKKLEVGHMLEEQMKAPLLLKKWWELAQRMKC